MRLASSSPKVLEAQCRHLSVIPSTRRRNYSVGSVGIPRYPFAPSSPFIDSKIIENVKIRSYSSCEPELSARDLKTPISSPALSRRRNVLESMVRAGRVVASYEYFHELKLQNIKLDTNTYNMMIRLFASVGEVEKAEEMLQDMKANEITPGPHTYALLIDLAANVGDKDLIMRYYGEMKAMKISPTPETFRQVLDSAEKLTPIISKTSYTAFLQQERRVKIQNELRYILDREITRIRDSKKASGTIEDHLSINHEATPYNERMAYAYANGNFQHFMDAFIDLISTNILPDSITKNLLKASLSNAHEASSIYNGIEAAKVTGKNLDVFALNYVFVSMVEAKAYYPALDLINLMKRFNLSVENLELNLMVKIHSEAGNAEMALETFYHLRSLGYRPDYQSYLSLFELFAELKDEERALMMLKDLIAQGHLPNETMTEALSSVLA